MKKESIKKSNYFLVCVFILYLLFNAVLLWRHEMWRDEINVWLMGRDLSIVELFREIKYQGHPCLWYLLIMPFAKTGLPCRVMGIISFAIMSLGAWLYLWKAPINNFVKAVTLFSPIFTYYYTEIARGYCLVAFIILLLAYFYRIRNQKPFFYGLLLGLLVQADTIALPVAGMISVMWLMENLWQSIKTKKKENILTAAKGLWIPLLSLFLFIFQFYRVSDSPVFQINDMGLYDTITAITSFFYHIFGRLTGLDSTGCKIMFALLALVGIGMGILRKNIWPMIVLSVTILFQSVFSCMVYQLNIFHFISLCFVYIWMVWVYAWKKEEQAEDMGTTNEKLLKVEEGLKLLAGVWIGIVAILMFVQWNSPEETSSLSNALYGSYSDGVRTAEYIEKNLSTEELIITTDVAFASTILGFAEDYRTYYAGSGKETSYADWSEEQTQSITYDEMLEWIREDFPQKESFILVQCALSCINGFDAEQGEVLYTTEIPSAKQENYTIYRVSLPK